MLYIWTNCAHLCDRQESERAIASWRWDFVQRKANKLKSLSCRKNGLWIVQATLRSIYCRLLLFGRFCVNSVISWYFPSRLFFVAVPIYQSYWCNFYGKCFPRNKQVSRRFRYRRAIGYFEGVLITYLGQSTHSFELSPFIKIISASVSQKRVLKQFTLAINARILYLIARSTYTNRYVLFVNNIWKQKHLKGQSTYSFGQGSFLVAGGKRECYRDAKKLPKKCWRNA